MKQDGLIMLPAGARKRTSYMHVRHSGKVLGIQFKHVHHRIYPYFKRGSVIG